MKILLILGILYIGYFLFDAYSNWRIDKKIKKYEKTHLQEEHDNRNPETIKSELTESQIKYREYLQSEHWQQTRKIALERAGYKCQVCGHKYDLQVHHNNYSNRGHEKLTDLVVLCGKCHSKFHK